LVLGPVSYAKVGPYTLFGNLEPNGWWFGSRYKSSSRKKWVTGRLTISQQVIVGWEIATADIMDVIRKRLHHHFPSIISFRINAINNRIFLK
jgi:hypothetical protein